MNITVNSISFKADQKLHDFAVKKTGKLELFFDSIIAAEVNMKVEKPEAANNKVVEIKLSVPNSADYLFAQKQADSFEEGIDLCVDALKKQLVKYKEKLRLK
ncbi:MAG: ribosome-associated translation inhibitor RaiA [Bacteroidales bacterium]|jgi:putative sigma-54 modulation protein|nr:ribosome-associated translation inhibitor RaiA [Bacteroidales bacterium]